MKRIFASALAVLMVAGMSIGIHANPEGRTAQAIKITNPVTLDGKLTEGEEWTKAEKIVLTSATNDKDSVEVRLMWDENLLYIFAIIQDSDWVGNPNAEFASQGENAQWAKDLSATGKKGNDNFGFSILVDETGSNRAFKDWSSIQGGWGDFADLGKGLTSWCTRYNYKWVPADTRNETPNNTTENQINQFAGSAKDLIKKSKEFSSGDFLSALGITSGGGYLLCNNTAGGPGRYEDDDLKAANGERPANNKLARFMSVANTVSEDGKIHYIETAIPWVSVPNNPYASNKEDAVQFIEEGIIMNLEMKYGSGNDSWYFNCKEDGKWDDTINIGQGFQIFKANEQWGNLKLVANQDLLGGDIPTGGSGEIDPPAPPTADIVAVASVVALASAAVVLSRKKKGN